MEDIAPQKGIHLKKQEPQNKPDLKLALGRFNFRLVSTLAGLIIIFIAAFKLLENLGLYLFGVILYSAITLVVALWYIIYNKGSTSGKVTPEMLPLEWSLAEKQAFIDDLAARRKRSKWALLILIPMILVFGLEMLELYVLPSVNTLLSVLGMDVTLG